MGNRVATAQAKRKSSLIKPCGNYSDTRTNSNMELKCLNISQNNLLKEEEKSKTKDGRKRGCVWV